MKHAKEGPKPNSYIIPSSDQISALTVSKMENGDFMLQISGYQFSSYFVLPKNFATQLVDILLDEDYVEGYEYDDWQQ